MSLMRSRVRTEPSSAHSMGVQAVASAGWDFLDFPALKGASKEGRVSQRTESGALGKGLRSKSRGRGVPPSVLLPG